MKKIALLASFMILFFFVKCSKSDDPNAAAIPAPPDDTCPPEALSCATPCIAGRWQNIRQAIRGCNASADNSINNSGTGEIFKFCGNANSGTWSIEGANPPVGGLYTQNAIVTLYQGSTVYATATVWEITQTGMILKELKYTSTGVLGPGCVEDNNFKRL